jgi:TolB-like protein/Flp pilus assembly protein TadD
MGLVSELRRRNVLRMAALYVVAAWLIMQVAGVLIDLGALPEWSGPWVLAVLAIGFPIALIFSWFYEITPEGLALEKDVAPGDVAAHAGSRRLDFVIIAILAAAVILFAYDKWWPEGPMEQSIAVLAFENLSGDPEQEYFSDGVSEAILDLLGQIKPLKVIARTSSFSFKDKDVDIPTMAAQMNVRHILEGSVRRSGDRMRITAQLIDTTDSTRVWSQSFDREIDDIFAVQDEIAAAISDALKVTLALAGGEALHPIVSTTDSTAAYDAYLQGRELVNRRGRANMEAAVRHFERALRLDESFAPAHAQLAIAKTLYAGASNEAIQSAIAHLNRAQELEPDLAEAHAGRALVANQVGDFESVVGHARKALASNPNYVDAMNWLQMGLGNLGRHDEAGAIFEQILVTDPLSVSARASHALWLSSLGRIEEAHERADQILAQSQSMGYRVHSRISLLWEGKIADSLFWALKAQVNEFFTKWAFLWVGEYEEARRFGGEVWIDILEGRWDAAVRAAQEDLQRHPDSKVNIEIAADALFYAGRIDEALPLYERLLDLVPEGQPMPVFYWPLPATMRLALARRQAGDEAGAQAAAQIVRQEHAAGRAAGVVSFEQDLTEAMLAAFDQDTDRAIAALRSAIQRGLRFLIHVDEPVFDDLRDEPRFVALRQEMEILLAEEHGKVLQLICFNNPVPEDWQPMPETCEGVVEQSGHSYSHRLNSD